MPLTLAVGQILMNTETWLKKRIKQCTAELKYWESREGNLAENQAHFWRGEVRYYKTAQQGLHMDAAIVPPVKADSKSDIIPAGEVGSQPRQ